MTILARFNLILTLHYAVMVHGHSKNKYIERETNKEDAPFRHTYWLVMLDNELRTQMMKTNKL